jgi:LPS-assembly protein
LPSGLSLAASARFDKDDFRTERTDVRAGYAVVPSEHLRCTYSEIKAPRPFKATGDEDRREVTGYRLAQGA